MLTRLARVRVTVTYAGALVAVTIVMVMLGPDLQNQLMQHASTNLHNLRHGHLGTLLGSAFVVDAGPIYIWLPGLVCLLAICETIFCSTRLIIAFAVGHIGATLLVAAGLTVALKVELMSTAVTRATDVGMSYGAIGVLGGLTAAIPRRRRPAWIGWWLGVAAASAIVARDFTDIGHVVALALGMAVSTRFGPPGPWTPFRRVLLGVAASFGFLVLANTVLAMVTGAALGTIGALIGIRVARRRVVRRTLAELVGAGLDPVGQPFRGRLVE
ncbi:hypothetical protein BH09ACT8_BH09ACT8_58230 [soil metagenome]